MYARHLKLTLLCAAAALLPACATRPVLAPAGAYTVGTYSVNLATDWNAIQVKTDNGNKGQLLTLDGPMLNSVYLFSDIEAGDALLKERRKENPVPKFDPYMTELELVEFLSESLQKGSSLSQLTPNNIRPDSFNGNDAVRFDFNAVTTAGLSITGDAIMSTADDTLDIIFFMAPTQYYAQKDRANVDSIFASVARGDLMG